MSLSISRVQWSQAAPLLKTVREKVFICEWRIPKRIEFDRNDSNAYHILVCDDVTQEPIATGRILATGEISRLAVLMTFRKKCVDEVVLKGLISIAKDLELDEVFIYSPLEALEYFRKHNFHAVGAVFMEAGIPKQRMTCPTIEVAVSDSYLNH